MGLIKKILFKLRWEIFSFTKNQALQRVWTGCKSEERFWNEGEKAAKTLTKYVDSDSTVLDIGCGIGRIEKFLAPHCKQINAIDLSRNMIRHAKNEVKHKNVKFECLNADQIFKFGENSFDLVFCFNVFHHIPKRNALEIFKQIFDITKPNKKAYLHFLNFAHPHWFNKYLTQNTIDPAYMRFYTVPEVKTILEHTGFDVKLKSNGSAIYTIATKP